MSTSRTTDRAESVLGRLTSDPAPSAAGLDPPESTPPRVLSGPASLFNPSTIAASVLGSAGESSKPERSLTAGRVGIVLSRERLAISVVESAMVPTQGPSVSLHRACTCPVNPLARTTESSGVEGRVNPLWTG
ncbi:hypothetical protein [Actinophytocola oryzae]|uniref:hypothetical protein n=1 Tax=Actinophytocola oryzae TaxID=502181 RepID=UPI00312C906C